MKFTRLGDQEWIRGLQTTEESSSSPAEIKGPRGGYASVNSEDAEGPENRHEPRMQRLMGRSLLSQTGSCVVHMTAYAPLPGGGTGFIC